MPQLRHIGPVLHGNLNRIMINLVQVGIGHNLEAVRFARIYPATTGRE